MQLGTILTDVMKTTNETSKDINRNSENEIKHVSHKGNSSNVSSPVMGSTEMDSEEARHEQEFMASLHVDQGIDFFCAKTKSWNPAKIINLTDSTMSVHFIGWPVAFDQTIQRSSSHLVAPRASMAAEDWAKHDAKQSAAQAARRARKYGNISTSNNENTKGMDSNTDVLLNPTFIEIGQTRSGRAVTKRFATEQIQKPKVKQQKTSTTLVNTETNSVEIMSTEDNTTEESVQPSLGLPEEDLCGICGELEDEKGSEHDTVYCDGGCLHLYHLDCLGLTEPPTEKTWKCELCRTNEQVCFSCGRNGSINEKGGVFKCMISTCGRFYHQNCVSNDPLSYRPRKRKTIITEDGKEIVDELRDYDAPFRCSRHTCSVCEDNKMKSKDMMFCLKCPTSFHPHCVPPSARYNSVGLLCSKHPDDALPKISQAMLLDSSIDIINMNRTSLTWPLLYLPANEPDINKPKDIHHFRLLQEIIDAVDCIPPVFGKLKKSVYVGNCKEDKEDLEDAPMCVCTVACDENCINRLSFVECYGPAPIPGKAYSKKDREWNCRLGQGCGNRALHQQVYPKTKTVKTPEKGWGLIAMEDISAGSLVIEYVGEVIDEEEKERRLNDHAKFTPNDKNMYIMELNKNSYIDARFRGSVSRFINHSCDPNCHLLKWKVKGVDRIAITALQDISKGEELSYDYQFHTKQAMEWKCHCQAPNCRGTMAPERLTGKMDKIKKMTAKERLKKERRACLQEKHMAVKEEKATLRRLNLTGALSIGEFKNRDNAIVRNGPPKRELEWAKRQRLFLTRNALRGHDFLERKYLKDRRIKKNV